MAQLFPSFMAQFTPSLTKDEVILDPACGTAGFLVSAYRHILQANTDKAPGDLFTIDERKRLANNIKGYDIGPDMVRLSLVNMYLHGFTNPQISEYDTLTSEDKWGEYADVILANPPFMTPKGGIKPHKRFSVQSNRSEVLFVDYIAEHLTPNGRSAIIVPEGVIFQSGKAYRQLRKELVEKYLWALVSLPSGVFKPYSGVKTSILFIDREIVRKRNSILLLKVDNDGFDLGDQRKKTNTDDLPIVLNLLNMWKSSLNIGLGQLINKDDSLTLSLEVKRSDIIKDANYSLVMSRYQINENPCTDKDLVELGKILEPAEGAKAGSRNYPIMSITMKSGLIDQNDRFKKRIASVETDGYKVVKRGELVVGFPIDEGVLGFQSKYDNALVSPAYGIWKIKKEYREALDTKYFEIILRSDKARELYRSNMQGSVNRRRSIPKEIFLKLKMPLPSLEVQRKIMAEIEEYRKIIDGARQVVEHWKPRITINPKWPVVRLGDVCMTSSGGTPLSSKREYYENGRIPWIRSSEVNEGKIHSSNMKITELGLSNSSAKIFSKGTILIAMYGATAGQVGILEFDAATNQAVCAVMPSESFNQLYLYYYLKGKRELMVSLSNGGAQPNISQTIIKDIQVPVPPYEIQNEIVRSIEKEQLLINNMEELTKTYEHAMTTIIERLFYAD